MNITKITALIGGLALSTTAAANEVELEWRGDYHSQSSYISNAPAPKDVAPVSEFQTREVTVGYKYEDSDIFKLHTEVNFNDQGTGYFEHAEFIHNLSGNLIFTLGKLENTGTGLYESERYGQYDEFRSISFVKNKPYGMNLLYRYGASNLTLNLQNQASDGAGGTYENSAIGGGLSYRTVIYGPWNTKMNYHIIPTIQPNKIRTYAGLGVQYASTSMKISLGYLLNSYEDSGAQASVSSTPGTKSSLILQGDFDSGGKWSPLFKVESSTLTNINNSFSAAEEVSGPSAADATGGWTNSSMTTPGNPKWGTGLGTLGTQSSTVLRYAVGVEYKPLPDSLLKYHMHYIGSSYNSGLTGEHEVDNYEIRVGATLEIGAIIE